MIPVILKTDWVSDLDSRFSVTSDAPFVDLMVNLRSAFLNEVSFIGSAAAIVACLMALFTVIQIAIQVMQGKEFPLWDIFKPAVIVLLCSNFNFVVSALDLVPGWASKAIDNGTKEITSRYDWRTAWNEVGEAYDDYLDSQYGDTPEDVDNLGDSVGKNVNNGGENLKSTDESLPMIFEAKEPPKEPTFWEKVKNIFTPVGQQRFRQQLGYYIGRGITTVCRGILRLLTSLTVPVLQGASQIYLALLGVLGPWVLVLSMLPFYKGSFNAWLARFMQVSFWCPICSIIHSLEVIGTTLIYSPYISGVAMSETYARAGDMGFTIWSSIIYLLCVVFMYFQVPTISSYVVNGASAYFGGNAARAASMGAGMVIRKALLKV